MAASNTPPTVDVTKLDIEPNSCPISAPLKLDMTYTLSEDFTGRWELKYMLDVTGKRQIMELEKEENHAIKKGENKVVFSLDGIDFEGVKSSLLNNVGLLLACLYSPEGEEVMQVSMVTQVEKKADGYYRTMFSPLE
mmetsp:Transcript_36386/g.94647  ORF Transcript_36386/g.94647 Transcript_36386/m.94647 type:complete len:137 (-) Transcript_36386:169-579(-)|eukprot:CAMPEP_0113888998 /NCGR_PEP_ID=MMETSP0780_2-20120614/13214_1 /TAXON_ID=652834 /ORGANISM="Palpitomonas bilix" /LENGTH=136 /DNA_ID=CAMNT_0000877971 /DNA_START=137 /DNA_END=547 /DNA_ORIENTATION=- /assembly_acc=CAM_ASM_000599